MSKKIQSRAMYNHEDDSSMSSAEAELGTPLSDTEETTTKTSSDLGSLVDDMNSVGFNSDQAVGSVGRSNASSGMSSIPTPQRVRRARRLQVDTSGRSAPVNLPFDDTTIFSPMSRRKSDDLPPFPTIRSISNISDSSGTGRERSISRDQFYENTIRKKREEKRKNSLAAAGAGDEPDSESDLSFDGDDDDGVVDELESETCPWIYDTDKDYTDFLKDSMKTYINLRDKPDLQEKILDHLNLLTMNIPQADQERVNQLEQTRSYLQGLQSGMIPYSDDEQNTMIGSKRKRSGGKRRTRKHKKTRSKKQKGGNIYSELLRAMLLQIGEYGPREGDWEAVIRALDQGADINEADDKGHTPLHIASERGHVEVVKFLLERGADINQVEGGGATPLLIASVYDHVEVVRILTEKGADINKADNDGATPLFAASAEGDVEVVRILAERGADINKADKYVYTPLYAASQAGHVDVVRFLTEKGADINKADNDGATPLLAASVYDHVEVVRILTEKGADINKADNDGITPLSIAVSEGYTEIVNILKPYIQIPVMTEEEFKTCDKNNEEKITCGITLDVLNRKNAVKPEVETEVDPNGNAIVVVDNNQCFERSALQEWLKIQKIHPLTRKKITNKWINKWYPLGVNALYSAQTGGKKRRTRKHKNARGGGACMSTEPDEYSSRVFSRKKVHWDTDKIESESGKTPHTIDSVDEFKRNHKRNHKKTSPSDKTIFGFKEWFDSYSSAGGKSKKTTKRRKVIKRRKTIKRKPRKKTYKKNRQTKRRSTRRRR